MAESERSTIPNLAARLRTRSLRAATGLFAGLFAVGSLIGLRQLVLGIDPAAFLAPFFVSVSCFGAWYLAQRGREAAARHLFVATMFLYLTALMAFGPFLLKYGIGFPLSVLTMFLFHLTHPPGEAGRIGIWLLFVLAIGYVAQAVVDIEALFDWQVATAGIAQLLILGFSTLVLMRLGRDWSFALAEAGQARTQLLEAHTLATQASRAKSAFLAAMSHELRTPLNAVIGYAELVAEDIDDPESTEDLERIQTAGRHLLELVNQVLDLSRIEAGKVQLQPETVALDVLVREVANILRPQVQANGNRLELRLEPVRPIALDPLRTRQIITNLMGNAAKFTSNGTIEVIVTGIGGWQQITVRDDGPGIPAGRLEDIFSPFEQASRDVQLTYGGSGLGLAISRRLAEEMGGRLSADSELGAGASFTLELPEGVPVASLHAEPALTTLDSARR